MHSIDNFDDNAISLVLVLVITKRLAGTSEERTFEKERTKALMLIIRCDCPTIVGPVTGALGAAVSCPASIFALVELALLGETEDVIGTIIF